jgi:hypothetical protein
MGTQDFAKFVASQQEAHVKAEMDWAGLRDEWLKNLDSLYQKVGGFLQEYIPDSISYRFAKIELNEPNIGRYLAKRMDIKIGRQRVCLFPVGTLLIGCRGRVDVVGSAGRGQILLVDAKARGASDLIQVRINTKDSALTTTSPQNLPASWVWKIVTNGAQKRFVDLEKESFTALLMEVANA